MSDHSQNMCNESMESKESDELLIDAMRAYPHLYSHQDRNFKDHLMRENSWKEISLAVNLPALECQNRWVRLRERFGKEKRQRELDSKSGSGVSRRSVFEYYENMSFLNDHIKRRKSHTNVSNLKRSKNVEVTGNKALTHASSATASSAMQIDRQVTNPSINSEIVTNTESPKSCIASQLSHTESNAGDEVLIQPCTNFSTFMENDFSLSSDSSRHCTDTPHSLDEYDQSSRNSMFSLRESSTVSPTHTIPEATPLSRRPPPKKKNDLTSLESSLVLLCQTMHQRLQDNRNPDVTGSSDEAFVRLIVNQLERLPLREKQRRQQAMMQILYEPYDP